MTAPALSPELADRLTRLLDWLVGGQMPSPGASVVTEEAYRRGIGLVDLSRQAFLVDQTVHEGVLWRLARLRRQHPPRIVVPAVVWKDLNHG